MADEPKKDSVDSRKEVLDFLKDIQAHYGTYQNHKETVGWAGVALFAGLMVGVATVLRGRLPQAALSCGARTGISLVVWALACFVGCMCTSSLFFAGVRPTLLRLASNCEAKSSAIRQGF